MSTGDQLFGECDGSLCACNYLAAAASSNPANRKAYQHVLFDLPRAERLLDFTGFTQDPLDQLQEEERGPVSICGAWLHGMNSPYKQCTHRTVGAVPWLGVGRLPGCSRAVSARHSLFPVRAVTVKYEIPPSACPDSCRCHSERRSRQVTSSTNKLFSRGNSQQLCWFYGESNAYKT